MAAFPRAHLPALTWGQGLQYREYTLRVFQESPVQALPQHIIHGKKEYKMLQLEKQPPQMTEEMYHNASQTKMSSYGR